MNSRWCRVWLLALVSVFVAVPAAQAQYFGRNKVQYRTFDFKILKTQHFDLYYYPEEAEAAQIASRLAERWYARLSRFFTHELRGRQAVILYASSSQFRQTNAVDEIIGEGTGGLTESIKRRIVLPMSGSLADTDHVLGHELVHAFQFDITGNDPRTVDGQAPEILAFPLWFVEGMAEYVSLGPIDPQTTMWLRDAAIRESLPAIKDLDNPKYFPYRWGHAFWAYIGAKYGDRAVASLLRSGANPRADLLGLARQLGTDPEALTEAWHAAIRRSTQAVVADGPPLSSEPRLVVSSLNGGGRYNLGPRLSPDGREIAFFSERGRFAIDLYVADAATGKIVRKLSSSANDPHFDSLEFLNSAGAWSPDGKTLAIAAIRRGRPVIALLDSKSGNVRRELPLKDLDDALNPSYSADGKSIVFSGNRGGLVDLYRIDVVSATIEQLTKDPYADLEPVMTPDGKAVIFVTERFSTNLETLEAGPLRLARLDLATKDVRLISGFLGGKHLSPQISGDGRAVTFLADPDGISNLYRMPIDGGPVTRVSSFLTGVAGITSSSPALSIAAASGRLAFSVFEDDGESIYVLDEADIQQTVAPQATRRAALLPGRETASGDVQALLSDPKRGLPVATAIPVTEKYGRRLKLDMISQPTFSAGVSSFGTYISGGISASFSDMLGDRQLGMGVHAAGTLEDIGGELIYINRQHRWNWAAAATVAPYRTGFVTLIEDPAAGETVLTEVIERQTSRGGLGSASYPLNTTTRIELTGGARQLSFSTETRTSVYDTESGILVDQHRSKVRDGRPLYLAEALVAIVHDTSFSGATSPIYGWRSRLEVGQSIGSLNYATTLVDLRRYFMPVRPVTIAVRGLQYSRWGNDAEDLRLAELYAGYPELVRGYGLGSFDARDCSEVGTGGKCAVFNNLRGSGLFVANLEVRAPLVGLLRHSLDYGRFPVEVAGFVDAGFSWTRAERPAFLGGNRQVVRSAGAAVRMNIFGLFVLEFAASHPFDRIAGGVQWQVMMRQGF
jgi:Tol biopolymer transport system component